MRFNVVIPARHASTRLPGKMLLNMGGKPMIQHVYERASQSGAERVIIATDHESIVDAVKGFSGEVILTSSVHRSGTERIAEVVDKLGFEDNAIIVNVQGDEPLIEPQLIRSVAENLAQKPDASIATVATPIKLSADFENPNIVKVVLDKDSFALYFSRASIPWPRDSYMEKEFKELSDDDLTNFSVPFYRHIGMYAYTARFVKTYVTLPPSPLEKIESLEQLRALFNGYRISVLVVDKTEGIGVDTREDYDKVKDIIERC